MSKKRKIFLAKENKLLKSLQYCSMGWRDLNFEGDLEQGWGGGGGGTAIIS
jgi:hypothetical protein